MYRLCPHSRYGRWQLLATVHVAKPGREALQLHPVLFLQHGLE